MTTADTTPSPIDGVEVYVVYKHPTDYPNNYIVRRQVVHAGQITIDAEPTAVTLTLETARVAIPSGLIRLPRRSDDEPQIVECWI